MSIKSLVINSFDTPPAKKYTWESISNIHNFTKAIKTQGIGDADSTDLSKLSSAVSGMPTVFARANMFRIALENIQDANQKNKGLMQFYASLINEWRGLISCIALNPESIRVKRIYLTYTDGKSIEETANLYEVKGSLGNMLFERKARWSDPNDDKKRPFLDVILFTKSDKTEELIGSTSPDSLFFTSASYNLKGESAVYLNENGGFIDPVKLKSLRPEDLNIIDSYVKRILKGMGKFSDHYKLLGIDSTYHNEILVALENWIKEINDRRIESKIPEFEQDLSPQIKEFETPFNLVANHSTTLSAKDGVIMSDSESEGAVDFDVNELLLPKDTKIACVDISDDKDYLNKTPLLLLKAKVEGDQDDIRYFMLPLSPKGIKTFGTELNSVLGLNNNPSTNESKLSGWFNPENQTLKVELNVISAGTKHGKAVETYSVLDQDLMAKEILVWPNFVSPQWEKYFLYSEMPHNNSNEWQAFPFCGDIDNRYTIELDSNEEEPIFLAKNGKEIDPKNSKIHIEYNPAKLTGAGRNYAYEIYESKKPFKGFKLMFRDKLVGYAVISFGVESDSKFISVDDKLVDLQPAHLGVDFGSTNSAVAYRVGDNKATGYQFSNRRVSLLSPNTKETVNTVTAGEEEVFFFQNDEIQSNAIKSVLALHDNSRIKDDEGQNDIARLSQQYVKGGFPCFEKNLPIYDSKPEQLLLKFRKVGEAILINNMKWDSAQTGDEYKKAHRHSYLKGLLLQVYSDLFANGLYPKSLKWAYPSALPQRQINDYNSIWTSLKDINPLVGDYNLNVMEGRASITLKDTTSNDWGSDSNKSSGDSWGDTSNSSSGWGDSSTSDNGWGEDGNTNNDFTSQTNDKSSSQNKIKEIVIENGPISFDFSPVNNNVALTESEAVANYLYQDDNTRITGDNQLLVCFDIGGSTTDISILAKMLANPKESQAAPAIVKQSSIRFAAQRVAQASKYSKGFKSVLINTLNRKGVKLDGINKGEDKFSQNTAPYYFEQLVDRLDENDFDSFYKELGSSCKDIVAVNLYVTGLILFYAGQITKKVITEIEKSPNKNPRWSPPKVQIVFTGKGSRIMDWLKAINPNADKDYYSQQFINGFGGMGEAKAKLGGPPIISRELLNPSDIKLEVAKGLAEDIDQLLAQNISKDLEVFGEDGFVLNGPEGTTKINADDSISCELMACMGNQLQFMPENPNQPCPRFMQFASMYFQIASEHFDLKATKNDFNDGFKNMNIASNITLLPEFKRAKKEEEFDFVSPIIILEGVKFLEDVILQKMND
jgi:hypothetical protein